VGVPRQAVQERRTGARATVALDLRLSHKAGRPLTARTIDLSAGGAHVLTDRPLRIDEEMRFDVDLPAGGRRVDGIARVLRQDRHNAYALRFERVAGDQLAELQAFVDATAGGPLH
jgi:c-di-GMP-binding flagellar brake protein YcgR